MPQEIKRRVAEDGSIHYPIDGPWPSPETEQILKAAINEYDALLAEGKHKTIRLLASSHFASEGYWIEVDKDTPVAATDRIVRRYRKGGRVNVAQLIDALSKMNPDALVTINIKQYNKVYGKQLYISDAPTSCPEQSPLFWVDQSYGGCCITLNLPEKTIISNWPKDK
jgi:hypothetical protein